MRVIRILVLVFLVISIGIFAAGFIRERQNEDPDVPVITAQSDTLEITTNYTIEQLLEGLSAWDDTDGDLTDQIIVGDFSRFIEPGLCSLTYVVFDSSNQAATYTRQIRFTDYELPKFSLSAPLQFTVGSEASVNDILHASDVLDGDISAMILESNSDVDPETVGTYHVDVEVSNRFGGLEELSLPVHVTAAQELHIRLSSYLVYLHTGQELDPNAYIEGLSDTAGNEADPSVIEFSSNVDTGTPGCYEVHYIVDLGNGQTGETWMIVVVRD